MKPSALSLLSLVAMGAAQTSLPSLSALAALEKAYDSQFPLCPHNCWVPAAASAGCQDNDFSCACANQAKIQAAAATCYSTCNTTDITAASAIGQAICSIQSIINAAAAVSTATPSSTGHHHRPHTTTTNPDAVTTVVDCFVTVCAEPTVFTVNDECYTATSSGQAVTVTNCPCTIEVDYVPAAPTGAPPVATGKIVVASAAAVQAPAPAATQAAAAGAGAAAGAAAGAGAAAAPAAAAAATKQGAAAAAASAGAQAAASAQGAAAGAAAGAQAAAGASATPVTAYVQAGGNVNMPRAVVGLLALIPLGMAMVL